jgi:hypothetical protein
VEEARQYSAVSDYVIFLPILVGFAGIFGWEAYAGLTRGVTRFPMRIVDIEEFERGHTMFWGIIGANILVSVAGVVGALLIVMGLAA